MSRAFPTTFHVAVIVFVAAVLVAVAQLLNPPQIVVTAGTNGGDVVELGSYFTYREVGVVAVAASLLGASGTYLVLEGRRSTAESKTDEQADPDRAPTDGRGFSYRDDGIDDEIDREVGRASARGADLLERRREELEEVADRLADTERVVYETVLEADGRVPQSDIVERTDVSKASVSRALDGLESKGLVERKRRGMGNVVRLR
ncbi:helix-turn-helix transcriptional regulator [Halopiger goleimassiliensis]|uniref:helix-turn-helix transcriptional regulator n=1 Tax=Halopiger goleimassiliensis TaxID=1293048 RepID=UPI000677AC17|nr:MarR family transcriptional regulator [Halopiger goleimassiliensis]